MTSSRSIPVNFFSSVEIEKSSSLQSSLDKDHQIILIKNHEEILNEFGYIRCNGINRFLFEKRFDDHVDILHFGNLDGNLFSAKKRFLGKRYRVNKNFDSKNYYSIEAYPLDRDFPIPVCYNFYDYHYMKAIFADVTSITKYSSKFTYDLRYSNLTRNNRDMRITLVNIFLNKNIVDIG